MRKRAPLTLLAGLSLAAFCFGCKSSQTGTVASPVLPLSAPSMSASSPMAAVDQTGAPLLPDPKMTPGAVLPVTKADICVPGYSQKVRNVPESVKKQAYAEYGITHHKTGEFEVDHLISLELGGSNSLKNLWPESYLTQPWNAHVKDQLENKLHAEVCSGKIDLPTAQHDIANDWISSYKRYFHTNVPLSKGHSGGTGGTSRHPLTDAPTPSPTPSAPPDTSTGASSGTAKGQVWVNLKSGKYFYPGSHYYGHTKQGQYLSEADAKKQGYVAAQGQ